MTEPTQPVEDDALEDGTDFEGEFAEEPDQSGQEA